MKKTLYSLMLNEEVVREIDRMAHRMGTNRSALINQILADYTSVVTPERRIENIFHEIEQLVAPARDLVPFFAPHTTSMSLKSSLEYKYRPTVKYEVALYGDKQEGGLGELAVIFRTQSAQLLQSMTQFFPPLEADRGCAPVRRRTGLRIVRRQVRAHAIASAGSRLHERGDRPRDLGLCAAVRPAHEGIPRREVYPARDRSALLRAAAARADPYLIHLQPLMKGGAACRNTQQPDYER